MMVAPVPDIGATSRSAPADRAVLDATDLFVPGLAPALIAMRAAELLAATLGDAAFLTLVGDEQREEVPAVAFADPALRARWQALAGTRPAIIDAARQGIAPAPPGEPVDGGQP